MVKRALVVVTLASVPFLLKELVVLVFGVSSLLAWQAVGVCGLPFLAVCLLCIVGIGSLVGWIFGKE